MMNPNTNNPPEFDGEPLPADLQALANALDALGAADVAGAPLGIEDRIWGASGTHIAQLPADISPVAARLHEVALAARAAAPASLEPGAFELSREAIAGGLPTLRLLDAHDEQRASVVVVDRFRFARRALSMAAAVALVGVGVGIYANLRPSRTVTLPSTDLAERFDSELSTLFEVVEITQREAINSTRDSEVEFDSTWLDEVYTEDSL